MAKSSAAKMEAWSGRRARKMISGGESGENKTAAEPVRLVVVCFDPSV